MRRGYTAQPMTADDFRTTLGDSRPPGGAGPALQALWHDGRGDWDRAHEVAQEIEGQTGAWVHAYLHRKEGDAGNAAYWYRRAGRPVCGDPLDAEWQAIVTALLAESRTD